MAEGGTVTVKVKPEIDLEAVAALPQDVIDALADRIQLVLQQRLARGQKLGLR